MTIRLFVALMVVAGCAQEGVKVTAPDASPGAYRGPGELPAVEVGADAQPAPLVASDAGTAAPDALAAVVADTLPTALDSLTVATQDAWIPSNRTDTRVVLPDATPDPTGRDALPNGPETQISVALPGTCPSQQIYGTPARCAGFWPSSTIPCIPGCQDASDLSPIYPLPLRAPAPWACLSRDDMDGIGRVVCIPAVKAYCDVYCPVAKP